MPSVYPRGRRPFTACRRGAARHARADAAYGGALRFRLLRAARDLHQHAQRLDDRALPHGAAADRAKAALAMDDAAVARGDGKMHEADRFAGHGAAGPGDAGDGDGQIDAGAFQRTDRHLRWRSPC